MRKILLLLTVFLTSLAQAKPLNYYFDENIEFNPEISTPEQVLGYEVGEWHVRHDQLVRYMQVLAEQSDRVTIETIGYSHERRPQVMLTIASPERLANIEQVRKNHLATVAGEREVVADDPAVVYMGYSVHGNEASGANAALLVAYYLAAASDERVNELLNSAVVLLDPSLNPDGVGRFANWVNTNKAMVASADPQTREHKENWPSSRTNHYWFDLNRDWLPVQHPESQARIAQFHRWKPNVLTDFHEMGPNSTYFFQPGIPSRKNPYTPDENVTLTKQIATHHAAILDQHERLYFTEEAFDDFYAGKGSTYPDLNGSVGILFEQGSSRGHIQNTINGPLEFAFTIKNQLLTSLSSFDGLIENSQALREYQQNFYKQAAQLASGDKLKGYVISTDKDKSKAEAFLSLLSQHNIKAYALTDTLTVEKQKFATENSYYIPLAQPQYRLIKSIFSEQTSFEDNTFYDVSTWNLGYAFNLRYAPLSSAWGLDVDSQPWTQSKATEQPMANDAYAYAFEWYDYEAPKLLSFLLKNDVQVRVAHAPLSAMVAGEERQFEPGTVLIPAGIQTRDDWRSLLSQGATEHGQTLFAINSGLTPTGVDLGSRQLSPVKLPKVLLLGGQGISQYELGEMWYYFDRDVGVTPSIVEWPNMSADLLANYTHVYMVDGNYSKLSERQQVALHHWVRDGGVLWTQKRAAKFMIDQQALHASYVSPKDMAAVFDTQGLTYEDKSELAGKQRIAGAIFNTNLDLTHPLAYSYTKATLPVFKNNTLLLEQSSKPFVNVATYTKSPLLAGYTHKNNEAQIAQGAALVAHSYGKGVIIGSSDNPVFRGYWFGTSRLVSNAAFFGSHIRASGK